MEPIKGLNHRSTVHQFGTVVPEFKLKVQAYAKGNPSCCVGDATEQAHMTPAGRPGGVRSELVLPRPRSTNYLGVV